MEVEAIITDAVTIIVVLPTAILECATALIIMTGLTAQTGRLGLGG